MSRFETAGRHWCVTSCKYYTAFFMLEKMILECGGPDTAFNFVRQHRESHLSSSRLKAASSRSTPNYGRTVATTIDLGSRHLRATARVCSWLMAA